jgi:dimethylhistidine N-methyltransferase
MLDAIGSLPADPEIAEAALAGLTQPRKTLPPKLFYDAEGCRLFGEITELPEYYVTRTERGLLRSIAPDVGAAVPAGAALVEYGASREDKARVLLTAMRAPAAYVPIDVAAEALDEIAGRMADGPVALHPIAADFLEPLTLPPEVADRPVLGFFPGSTIGNLEPATAIRFLTQARDTLGAGALFLIGVDLRKDPNILVPAYNDAAGVTAAFNRNLLVRLNREAGADFNVESFAHEARWNDAESRIEMHLVSRCSQTVRIAGRRIAFRAGESIHTENSYKHTIEGFRALAARAGWRPLWIRTDSEALFSHHLLRAGDIP